MSKNNTPPPKSSTVSITPPGSFVSVPIGNWANYNIMGFPTFNISMEGDEIEEIPSDGRDGLTCTKCKEFYKFVVANQIDKSFICYGCRNGY